MTAFKQLQGETYGDAEAEKTVDGFNGAIREVAIENQAVDRDFKTLIEKAMTASPDDAAKLAKSVEGLRVRRLRNLLVELHIPDQRDQAVAALRAAASTEVARIENELAAQEAVLSKASRDLGYEPNGRQHTALFTTDKKRVALTIARRAAALAAGGAGYKVPSEDEAHRQTVEKAIAAALR